MHNHNIKKTLAFLKRNKGTFVQMGIIAGTVAIMGDTTYAGLASGQGGAFGVIETPLQNFQTFMTGSVPKAIGTIGCGIVGASWAMNIENQMTKAGMRVIGGTAAAMGAGSLIASANSDANGLLMLASML
ncbi:TrbC/VirB2 family protein [uncultured Mitsuokella sp.]|uniref:TrbC/VirB2 family protein n=1 Tax=uncultured Mitsuokella sp. TaxID=453120 RepID=UPI00266CB01D|nr:TrbC/VirB2 family protein [uncultured Mitsuokella sp.]